VKIKRVKIGIKDLKTGLQEFVQTAKAIQQGKKVKKEERVYFTSFEAFRKALTPKRLELLHLIKTHRPSSINQVARLVKRDIKNVSDDLKYLAQIGLVERKETEKEISPTIDYDKILLEIAV
jgi:predicted transcriptional regulator